MHSLGAGSFTNPTVQSVVRSVVIYMVLEASEKKMVNAFPWGGVIHKPYSSVSCSFCRNLHGFGSTKSASHARPKIKPMPETVQIEPPRRHFVDFWSQGRKVLRSSLPGVILSTSGNNARKCSNRVSWT